MSEACSAVMCVSIKDKGALRAAFMPFVKGGGLFIPTKRSYKLGDRVFVLLSLLDSGTRLPVMGQVAWLTPMGAQGGKTAGVGIRCLSDNSVDVVNSVQAALSGDSSTGSATQTM